MRLFGAALAAAGTLGVGAAVANVAPANLVQTAEPSPEAPRSWQLVVDVPRLLMTTPLVPTPPAGPGQSAVTAHVGAAPGRTASLGLEGVPPGVFIAQDVLEVTTTVEPEVLAAHPAVVEVRPG